MTDWLQRPDIFVKRAILFVAHQFIAPFSIVFVSLAFTDLILTFPQITGHVVFAARLRHAITQGPFFPMHIILAICMGWYLSQLFGNPEMLWVWVVPLCAMCYLVATNTSVLAGLRVYAPKAGQTAWAHYFGWGCLPDNACPDQNSTTLLLYVCCAYAVGAAIGRKRSRFTTPLTEEQFWSTLLVGFLFLLPLIGLVFFDTAGFFVKNLPGWKSPFEMTRTLLLDVIGLDIFMVGPAAAVGLRVIYFGFSMRKSRITLSVPI